MSSDSRLQHRELSLRHAANTGGPKRPPVPPHSPSFGGGTSADSATPPYPIRSPAAKPRQPALICIENVTKSRRPIANPSATASQLRLVQPLCRSATHTPGARVESPTGGESRFQVPATLASTGGPKRLPVPPQTNPLPAPRGLSVSGTRRAFRVLGWTDRRKTLGWEPLVQFQSLR